MGNVRFPSSPEAEPRAPTSAVTSSGSTCPGCGQAVDPLRAGHVAVLESGFRYFCDGDCKQTYLRSLGRPPEEDVATARPPDVYLANGTRRHPTAPTATSRAIRAPGSRRRLPPSVKTVAAVATTTAETEPVTTPVRATLPSPPAPAAPRRVSARTPSSSRTGAPRARCCGDGARARSCPPSACSVRPPRSRASRWFSGRSSRSSCGSSLVRRDAADPHPWWSWRRRSVRWARCAGASPSTTRAPASIAVLAGLACAAALAVETIVGRAQGARQRGARADRARRSKSGRASVHGEDTVEMPPTEVRPGRAGARRGRRGGRRGCDGDRRRGARRPVAGCTGRGDQARGRPDRRRRARAVEPACAS